MLGLITRSVRPVPAARAARLALTRLETRDCPAAPALAINVTPLGGNQVLVSGHVSDETPSRVRINLGGVAGGVIAPNGNGSFSYTTTLSGTGQVYAQAIDREELYSNLVGQVFLGDVNNPKNSAPQIVDFSAENQNGVWVIRGRVIDENPGGMQVTLRSSISQLNNVTVTTDADGSFSYTFTQPLSFFGGSVSAQTTDDQGLTSDPVFTYVG